MDCEGQVSVRSRAWSSFWVSVLVPTSPEVCTGVDFIVDFLQKNGGLERQST